MGVLNRKWNFLRVPLGPNTSLQSDLGAAKVTVHKISREIDRMKVEDWVEILEAFT